MSDEVRANTQASVAGDKAVRVQVVDSAGTTVGNTVALATNSPLPLADSRAQTASASAPLAAASVAGVGSLVAGIYRIELVIALSGTAETAKSNLQLGLSGSPIADTTIPTISAAIVNVAFPRITVASTSNLNVLAVANATGGSVYTISVTATKIGS